jgi:hypothetical protein
MDNTSKAKEWTEEEIKEYKERVKAFKVRPLEEYSAEEKEEHFARIYKLAADMFKFVSEGVVFGERDTSIIMECVISVLGEDANGHLDYMVDKLYGSDCADDCEGGCDCCCCGDFDDEQEQSN